MATAKRATTCGADVEGGGKCKRLPAHHGEHRLGLTRKAARAAKRAAEAKRLVAAPAKRARRPKAVAQAGQKPSLARPSVG